VKHAISWRHIRLPNSAIPNDTGGPLYWNGLQKSKRVVQDVLPHIVISARPACRARQIIAKSPAGFVRDAPCRILRTLAGNEVVTCRQNYG